MDNYVRSRILRNSKNLRKSSIYQNVFTSPDLLSKVRESNKILHQELRSCKEAGEANLIIKCGRIVTKQVVSNPATATMDSSTVQIISND